MEYTVQQLATLAGVSVRTLHHYDEVGLLTPARVKHNGYRHYGEAELLKLQQILFFRELDFSLDDIKQIMHSPHFDMAKALRDHRHMIELKKKRLDRLVVTIDKTIIRLKKNKNKINMSDINKNQSTNPGELYSNFDSSEVDQYADEAKARWGNTEMYKQSQERVKKMSKADMARIKKAGEDLTQEIAELMPLGPTHASVQKLIDQHYNALRTFYEPNLELYRGLANMYVADPRFTAYYEKYAKGLAQFMTAAMNHYVDVKEGKN